MAFTIGVKAAKSSGAFALWPVPPSLRMEPVLGRGSLVDKPSHRETPGRADLPYTSRLGLLLSVSILKQPLVPSI